MFLGPTLNYFTTKFHFETASGCVDEYTVPGFIMAILWFVYQIQMIFTYTDPREIQEEEKVKEEGNEKVEVPLKATSLPIYPENKDLSPRTALTYPKTISSMFERYSREFLVDNIMVCFSAFFLTNFLASNLEAAASILMQSFFHFDILHISLFFGGLAFFAFISCLVVSCLGKKDVDDRRIVLTGFFLIVASAVGSLCIFSKGTFNQNYLFTPFVIIFVTFIVGYGILVSSNYAIFSKLVSNESMGFAMGLKKSIDNTALIMGPLWSGSLTDQLSLLFGVNLGITVFVFALFMFSYKRMVPIHR